MVPRFNVKDECVKIAPTVIANHIIQAAEGDHLSLILASLRGNFSTRLASQYEKLKPLKDAPLLYEPEHDANTRC